METCNLLIFITVWIVILYDYLFLNKKKIISISIQKLRIFSIIFFCSAQHAQIKQRHVLFNRFFFGGKNKISISVPLSIVYFISLKLFIFISMFFDLLFPFVTKINSFIPQNLFNIPHNWTLLLPRFKQINQSFWYKFGASKLNTLQSIQNCKSLLQYGRFNW